jgi:hypothetical protein
MPRKAYRTSGSSRLPFRSARKGNKYPEMCLQNLSHFPASNKAFQGDYELVLHRMRGQKRSRAERTAIDDASRLTRGPSGG